MKETVVDALVYLFQNFMSEDEELNTDRESLQDELVDAGFPNPVVDKALEWLEGLVDHQQPALGNSAQHSIRVFSPIEEAKLDADARGFLLYLESAGVLSSHGRELIMDRVLALESDEIGIEQLKWLILMVLFNQPGQEEAYAWMEDFVFDGFGGYLH